VVTAGVRAVRPSFAVTSTHQVISRFAVVDSTTTPAVRPETVIWSVRETTVRHINVA